MATSVSERTGYPAFCKLALENDKVFLNFKSNRDYRVILEHVSYEHGLEYLNYVKNNYNFLLKNIEKYKENDSIGSPNVYKYEFGNFSPTTLRYMKVLGDLSHYYNDLNNLDIVEIGCGYGGQAKLIMDTYDVKSYTIIDLPIVLKLIKKYLELLNVDMSKIKFKEMDELTDSENFDLVISNYAYSECTNEIRKIYFDKVLSKSKYGYLQCNILTLEQLNDEIINKINNCRYYKENPLTCDGNYLLIWN